MEGFKVIYLHVVLEKQSTIMCDLNVQDLPVLTNNNLLKKTKVQVIFSLLGFYLTLKHFIGNQNLRAVKKRISTQLIATGAGGKVRMDSAYQQILKSLAERHD